MAKLVTTMIGEQITRDKNGRQYALKYATLVDTSKWSGEDLRRIRKEKGVGRPPKTE